VDSVGEFFTGVAVGVKVLGRSGSGGAFVEVLVCLQETTMANPAPRVKASAQRKRRYIDATPGASDEQT